MTIETGIQIHFPAPLLLDAGGSSEDSFSVEACGTGSFTGLVYFIPAHASGTLKAVSQAMCMTSADVETLNSMMEGMLKDSVKEVITTHSEANGFGNLSFFRFFSGGASASAAATRETMKSSGLTEAQINTFMAEMFKIASTMKHVELDFRIDNKDNNYSVSGDLQLYTLSGQIKTSKGTKQYRLLAEKGTAGNGAASATGKIIPLGRATPFRQSC